MPTLIGINGPMTSGKDTAYSFIQQWAEERGVSTCRRGFADLLKWSAYRIFKPDATIEEGVAWANSFKWTGSIAVIEETVPGVPLSSQQISYAITGRQLLQHYGTEAHRDVFDPEFWVNALLPPHGQYLSSPPTWWEKFDYAEICVITDLRFPNEAERIKELDGYVWVIERPSVEREVHVSEQKLAQGLVDVTINNDSTLDAFRENVQATMTAITTSRP